MIVCLEGYSPTGYLTCRACLYIELKGAYCLVTQRELKYKRFIFAIWIF